MKLINLLMYLYPKDWRERYGEEFIEVIKSSNNTNIYVILDIIKNAISTRFHPESYKKNGQFHEDNRVKDKLIKAIVAMGVSFIVMVFGIFIGMLITRKYDYRFQDVLLIEGILVTIVGFFSITGGNASGINLAAMGQQSSQYASYQNLKVLEKERNLTKYHKNFTKHSIIRVTFNGLTIPLGGILIVIISYLI